VYPKYFTYLGYTFKRNNGDETHIKNICKKVTAAMIQVWGIGEKKFGGDFRRRMLMFNILVKSIIMYAVEIWGMKEWKEVEVIQERYLKGILRADRCTVGYIVREKTKTEKISIETGIRILKYEEKVKHSEKYLQKECRKEIDREGWEKTKMGRARKEMLERANVKRWELEAKDDKGENTIEAWKKGAEENEEKIREEKLRNSTYGREYNKWREENLPKYLEEKGKMRKIKTIARFRLCNEWRASKYWMEEQKKKCRMCGREEETGEHVLKATTPDKSKKPT